MPPATVPEAAVHKHGESVPGENKIWLSRQRTMPAPAFDSMSAKDCGQFQFGVLVAFRPNGSQVLRRL